MNMKKTLTDRGETSSTFHGISSWPRQRRRPERRISQNFESEFEILEREWKNIEKDLEDQYWTIETVFVIQTPHHKSFAYTIQFENRVRIVLFVCGFDAGDFLHEPEEDQPGD